MIGPLFVCSKDEQRVLAALRATGSWDDAARAGGEGWNNPAVTQLYRQYLQHRIALGDDPDRAQELQEGYLDWLDALLDRYGGPAVLGDQKAARLVLAVIQAIARLRQQFRLERGMVAPQASPVSDSLKDARTSAEELTAEYILIEKAHQKLGVPVPANVTMVYRRTLAELAAAEELEG